MLEKDQTLLVAGCGFLGCEIARQWLAAGGRVLGLTRSGDAAAVVRETCGIVCLATDLGDASALAATLASLPPPAAVVLAASSSRGGVDAYQRVFVDGMAHLIAQFPRARHLLVSSTSVYAQTDGGWVDESSPAEPTSPTGRVLRAAEDAALAKGASVLRLAGLYGPGRCVVLRKFLDGSAVLEDGGTRILNQIHRDDAAAAVVHLLGRPETGNLINAADDTPLSQRDTYTMLASRFHAALPPCGPRPADRKRGWSSKRVSNRMLRASGWSPNYPSLASALDRDPRILAGHPLP